MSGASRIEIRPMAGALGADISGIDLSRPLDDAGFAPIERALHDHLVIFFHGQALTPEQHLTLTRRFGPISRSPYIKHMDEYPDIIAVLKEADERNISTFGNAWHSDFSFLEEPPLGSVLYAREVPDHGGDMLFANMYSAYEALSEGMRKMLDGLNAMHSGKPYGVAGIPADATVVKAVLNWTIMGFEPPDATAVLEPPGGPAQTLTGQPLGEDASPCWPLPFIYGFTADVCAAMTPTGNGTYTVRLPDSGVIDEHPTAAVAGTPRDAALELIRRLEPFDRGRYAGPVGWVDGHGNGEWAIALRCAQIGGAGARVHAGREEPGDANEHRGAASATIPVVAHAGAGIVARSDPETELLETRVKFRPIVDALA